MAKPCMCPVGKGPETMESGRDCAYSGMHDMHIRYRMIRAFLIVVDC